MTTPSFVEVTASTIEDAIQKGLKQLGVGPGQVIVEVLEEPSRGLFGFGGKQARVRLKRLTPPPHVIERAKAAKKTEEEASAGEPDTTDNDSTDPDAHEGTHEQATASPTADTTQDEQSTAEAEPEDAAAVPSPADAVEVDDEERAAPETPKPTETHAASVPGDEAADTSDTDEPSVVHGDHDDFFDEDGSYGADEDEFFTPAVQKQRQRERQQPDSPEKTPKQHTPPPTTDETTTEEPESSDESRRSRKREQAQQERRRKLQAQEQAEQPVKRDDEPQPAADKPQPTDTTQEKQDQSGRDTGVRVPPLTFPENGNDAEIGEHVLGELLDIMRIRGDIEVSESRRSNKKDNQTRWVLNIKGDGRVYENLVGKGGETLSALQYLTRLMVSKRTEARANIIVDVNDQRATKADKLSKLAMRMADQVVETGRTFRMEPMPSHERRIVHTTLRKRDDVETESQGRGDNRRVLIIPTKKDNQ